jgi:ABC-type branched-subunit amino acid transport system substrate-binding protein
VSTGLAPGARFAGYRIESLIGRGGMGVVYRATDLSLERPVALKLIAPELAEDPRFRERFLKEPRLAASLDHPNVVPIYEAGEREGQLYLAMRYVEGSDLKTILDSEGTLPPERSLAILAQVAGALDSAHRRGLVHRDVKPANVLLDEDGHVYLTDFGITKQLGRASTDTGQLVGTLDYLAPEQLRGEPVDGRTDCYSLACVLYECLSGAPPFHRETEAETMWAHMQEKPAVLPGYPPLDPVHRRALAKEKEDRYESCAALVEAAREALGIAAPPPPVFAPPALVRRRRAILVAGLLVLALAVAAGIVALTTSGDDEGVALGNGVAAIDPAKGGVTAFSETESAPGNVAVGEGSVWILNTETPTVSQIDPKTKETVKSFRPGGVPSEIAAGEGAVWIGNAGGGDQTNTTVSVSRIDPDSTAVTRTQKLPGGDAGVFPTAGLPRLAVGAGAVWAVNPDGSVSRIDPETGKLVARIDVEFGALTIAAGEEGVWFPSGDEESFVMRIDPRTNRVSDRIRVGSGDLWGVAVGAGSVWATARGEGFLWRIEPGRRPVTRTIDVGVGVTFVDFGEGAAWTGNYVDGVVSRIDPRTNTVTSRTSIGAPQALAAGSGAAWVSVAGGTTDGALRAPGCGELASGGATPDVLIASDLPLKGEGSADPRAMENAIRFVLERHGFRAGEHTVGYHSCDVSTVQTGGFEFRKCAANANGYAHAEQLVAVVGTYSSFCAEVELPILNRAPGGPVPMISPSNTGAGLTRGGRLAEKRGEPQVYYPTGTRNFVRVAPREDLQGVGLAMLAERLGLERVYSLHERGSDWDIVHARPFRTAARRLGLRVASSRSYDPGAGSYDALAARVARSGAQAVFVAGGLYEGGDRLLKALRARMGTRVKLMIAETFGPVPDLLEIAGPAAEGVYMSFLDVPPAARDLSPAGQRFVRDFGALDPPTQYVLPAAQAAEVVLQAIARSDGTRGSVLEEMWGIEVKDGILGDFRLDRTGDITPAEIPIFRVTGETPPGAGVYPWFEGAIVDRVVTVPARLAR